MVPKQRIPTSPGEILLEEFLRPLNAPRLQWGAFGRRHKLLQQSMPYNELAHLELLAEVDALVAGIRKVQKVFA